MRVCPPYVPITQSTWTNTVLSTAVQMNWDWGFTWKEVFVDSCRVGFNVTREGPLPSPAKGNQGTGVRELSYVMQIR